MHCGLRSMIILATVKLHVGYIKSNAK